MKTMKNWLLTGLMFLVVSTVFSQGKITGTITDGQGSLPGANVAIKGSTTGSQQILMVNLQLLHRQLLEN